MSTAKGERGSYKSSPMDATGNLQFFFLGLALVSGGTLMYEVLLTRILSVLCWYYLAFVSISMAMFGMTAGALAVQLLPDWFKQEDIPTRLAQSAFALSVSMPITLIVMLSIPFDVSLALQTIFAFLLFSSVIAVPFFFSGVVVCLSLTRTNFPFGRVYFADLGGAALGCLSSILLLKTIDAPSGIFVIAGLLFLGAACYASYAGVGSVRRNAVWGAVAMLVIAALNSTTSHGIQPIWSKGKIDRRENLLTEVWNPISKVRASRPMVNPLFMQGPSPLTPKQTMEQIILDIDNDANTPMMHFQGDLKPFEFLNYDVTSLAAQVRVGGSAAIIGVGGGRDAMTCAVNGFQRIVGVEINSAIYDLDTKKLVHFSNFDKIPNLELYNDEGRSFLTRTDEKFDMIQASLIDTWAATSAGALTLSENSLYTVDAWRIFYEHLKPGGVITFSRWYSGPEAAQTYRLFAVAWATLLSKGVTDPSRNVALVSSGGVATLLASNQAFTAEDLQKIRAVSDRMQFKPIFLPGEETEVPELRTIAATHTIDDLTAKGHAAEIDFSPVYDNSPYFFNALRLARVPQYVAAHGFGGANLRALMTVFAFMLAAFVLVVMTIVLPLRLWASRRSGAVPPLGGGIAYFIGIGIGFILVEMAVMQQLSIFLGHPTYAFVVGLAGLILSTGIGSLISDRLSLATAITSRLPALGVVLMVSLYTAAVIPLIHRFTAAMLPQRVLLSLALIIPCGLVMGFCFPVGMRWMTALKQEDNLPWMWALNGAAATLGSFIAILISMETTITICALTGAGWYLLAAAALPSQKAVETATQPHTAPTLSDS